MKKVDISFVIEFVYILENPPWCMMNNTFKLLDEYTIRMFDDFSHESISIFATYLIKMKKKSNTSYIPDPESQSICIYVCSSLILESDFLEEFFCSFPFAPLFIFELVRMTHMCLSDLMTAKTKKATSSHEPPTKAKCKNVVGKMFK